MNVLIIPEDFRKDQYILKPLFGRLLRSVGNPRAKIRVCLDPLLGGVDEATKSERLTEIVDRYDGMTDMFILCVDRDGDVNRRRRLDELEREFQSGRVFLAANAWEELETWVLAGLDLPNNWPWTEVRAEAQVKERYFEVLAHQRGVDDHPGGGRGILAEEAAPRIAVIRQKCREDFDELAGRIKTSVARD